MAIKEAIILAGGLGTRLREAVPELPKCMAPVSGKPFIDYVIGHLREEGIEHFIFSLGYKHEIIEEFLLHHHHRLSYEVSVETEPLGTGGAIRLGCRMASGDDMIVTNGDTLYKVDLEKMSAFHRENNASCTLALKPMVEFDRYGVVEIDKNNRITSFLEKRHFASGLINGGVYALNRKEFLTLDFPEKFSFEKDYLEAYHSTKNIMGIIQDEYFIDIGIPEDYARAARELK